MSDKPQQLVEEIVAQVVMADTADSVTFRSLSKLLHELVGALVPSAPALQPLASQAAKLAEDLAQGTGDGPAGLTQLSELAERLQRDLDRLGRGAPEALARSDNENGVLILEEHVDDEIFSEFLTEQKLSIEELEETILQLRRGNEEAASHLRRQIHTLKGEAGVLGLEALERVCHEVESHLVDAPPGWRSVDGLLEIKDWIAEALAAYERRRLPPRSPAAILSRLTSPRPSADLGSEPTVHSSQSPDERKAHGAPPPSLSASLGVEVPESPSTPVILEASEPSGAGEVAPSVAGTEAVSNPAPNSLAARAREEDELHLIAEFIEESDEGLGTVDQTLLDLERDGADPERINRLFRVFHTIKGVSGFLEMGQITSVAHTTETMLDAVRSGKLGLCGPVLDLVFDATAKMRELLNGVRQAIQQGVEVAPQTGVDTLCDRLAEITESGECPEETLLDVEPGQRLGEILVSQGTISPKKIEEVLIRQRQTGRPLGEELIADGAVEPKAVAQAIRAQNAARHVKIREVVKVDLERVDRLVETIGELVIVESMVAHAPEVRTLPSRTRNYLGQLAKITRELQEIGMRMRMVPVRTEFRKMSRMIRDLSRKSGKSIRLDVVGEGTEMDRSMVERIADPLVHLIRNAADHGIESPDLRAAAGKQPTGTIRLSAYHEGGSIVIEVSDDGKGIDRNAVLSKAKDRGLVTDGDKLSEPEIFDLIFAPGFSTASQVTEVSGRGVGMDVVKRNIESMRGRIVVHSNPGKGTTFRMVLPLTLAIIDGMVVRSGTESFIVPTLSIVESLQPTADMLATMAGRRELVVVRGEPLPLLRLDQQLAIPGAEQDPTKALIVIVENLNGKVGILADEVVTQQQVVIKSMGSGFEDMNIFSGAAILSDGRVGLIINVDELVAIATDRERSHVGLGGSAGFTRARPTTANTIRGTARSGAPPHPAE